MKAHTSATAKCQVCGVTKAKKMLIAADLVRPQIVEEIKKSGIDWDDEGFICADDLNRFRSRYIQSVLEAERGELGVLEHEVIESMQQHEPLSSNVNLEYEKQITMGERIADGFASFGGSWKFILIFTGIVCVWITVNSLAMLQHSFDPYPYILLNLVLSCLAAIQAPIIMMSQNRQEARDRLRSEYDYQINLKAELEIRHLHEKMDHLLSHQWQRLYEIQQIQVDLMEELRSKR